MFLKTSIMNQDYLNKDKTKFGTELRARLDSMCQIVGKIGNTYPCIQETRDFYQMVDGILNKCYVQNTYSYYAGVIENDIIPNNPSLMLK